MTKKRFDITRYKELFCVRVAFEGRHPFASELFYEAFGTMPWDHPENHSTRQFTLLVWIFPTILEARAARTQALKKLKHYYGYVVEPAQKFAFVKNSNAYAKKIVLAQRDEEKKQSKALWERLENQANRQTPAERATATARADALLEKSNRRLAAYKPAVEAWRKRFPTIS